MASFVRTATDADLAKLAGIEDEADAVFTPLFGAALAGDAPSGVARAAEPGFVPSSRRRRTAHPWASCTC